MTAAVPNDDLRHGSLLDPEAMNLYLFKVPSIFTSSHDS